jgi:hypothetical protein
MSSLSAEQKEQITRDVMNLLETWQVSLSDQVIVLGFPEGTKPRELKQYQQGTTFPDDKDILERVRILISIDEALHMQYPHHKGMVHRWMITRCGYFNKRKPIDIVLEKGLDGLHEVHRHLDCTQAWV